MTSPSPIRILSMDAKVRAVDIVGNLPEDGEWWVHYRKSGEGRTEKQNRLMRKWGRLWCKYYNDTFADQDNHKTPEEIHASFKMQHVLPKLIEDDLDGWWINAERRCIELAALDAQLDFCGRCIHSEDLAPDRYAEAMKEWETEVIKLSKRGFYPPHPEDLYQSALGRHAG